MSDDNQTLNGLKTDLEQEVEDGQLVFTEATVEDENISRFIASLPAKQLVLENPQLVLADQTWPATLTVTGGVADQWAVKYITKDGVQVRQATFVFTQAAADAPIDAGLTIDGVLTIAAIDIALTGILTEDNRMHFSLAAPTDQVVALSDIADYASNSRMSTYLPPGLSFTDSLPLTSLELTFGFETTSATSFSFTSDTDYEWEIITDVAALKKIGVGIRSAYYVPTDGRLQSSFSGEFRGTFLIGIEFAVILSLQNTDLWQVELLPADGNLLPDLSELAYLAGGASLQASVQAGLDALGLGDLTVDGVRIGFSLSSATLLFISIASHIRTLGIRVNVDTTLPNFQFAGAMSEDSRIDTKALVESFFGVSDGFPAVEITELALCAYPSQGLYTLSVTLEDDEFKVGPVGLQQLHIDIQQAATATGTISGGVLIGGVHVAVSASQPQSNSGWQFEGSTGIGQEIPIGTLIEDLVNLFGDVTLPATLADLVIENLSVSFNTLTGNFSFAGEAKFPIDDQELDIVVTIDVKHEGTNYTKAFGGWITIGSMQFTLNFIQNNTSDFFVATYSHTGEPQAVSIKDLMASVSSSVAAYIPDVLEVELKDVLFAYSKTTGTSPETKFLFGFDVGTGINLSNLPLVGHEFPAEQTIGVDDLQVMVASKLFNQALVSQLNALLPEGVTKLPLRDLNSGLSISAIMQFGGSPDTLDLPVASDRTTTQPPTGSTTGSTSPATSDNIKWFTLQKAFGPVSFQRVGVQYKDEAVWFLLDAAITGAGLTLSLNGLSVGSPLDAFDPQFNLLGLGVSYQGGSTVTIGGAFLRKQVTTDGETYDEYDGAVVIKAEQLTLSAMGSYAELKGQPSLFVYGLLDYPIGGPAFFFVMGLAAGFGYNRKLIAPTLDQVAKFPLVEEAINGIRTPTALTDELTKLQPYIPPSIGDNFLVFGVKFTSFKLIDSFVLLTVMFGKRLEVNVLGLSSLIVPTPVPGNPVTPLAKVQMELKATYYPDDGLLAINAQLTSDSYIISRNCHLAGGFAFYTWFTGTHAGDFVQTLGGYHPNFNKPSHYPTVPRLSFNWKVDNNLTLKGDAYYAITPSTLMAGGSLDASWKDGDIKATFKAKADFLISWKPYHYDAHISVNVSASYKFKVSVLGATVHKTISADVGADVHIWGPEFSGKASVDISVISFDITFGSRSSQKKVAIDWQTFKDSFLPASETVGISVGDGLVSAPQTQETYWVINPKHFYLVLNSAIPAKAAYRLNTKQSLVGTDQTPFGIGPMELKAEKLTSDFYVEITHDNVSVVNDEFALTPILKNVPVALWGETMTPSLKGPRFITDALCGFEVRPANPPTADVTQPIARSNLQYDSTPVDNAFAWASTEPFQATTQNDPQREATIRTTIVSDDAAAARTRLMAAMGVTATINLSEATADAFLIAPLIEA